MKNYEEENIKEFLLCGIEEEITKPTTNTSKVPVGIFFFTCLVSIIFLTFQLGMLISLSIISIFIILTILNFYNVAKFKKLNEQTLKIELIKTNYIYKGIGIISFSIILFTLSLEFIYICEIRNKEIFFFIIALYVLAVFLNIYVILFKIKKGEYKRTKDLNYKKSSIELATKILYTIGTIGFFIVLALYTYFSTIKFLFLFGSFIGISLSIILLTLNIHEVGK